MEVIRQILAKYTAFFVSLLGVLGIWGVLVIATLDAIIPVIPLDPVVAAYVYQDPHRAWLYVLMGSFGSAVGSLVPYWIGRLGGELFLLKRIDRKRMEEMRDRHEQGEFLFIMVPSMMPPGFPMKLFILAAGVFKMKPSLFLGAMVAGRIVRFGALSVLVVQFGPDVVRLIGPLARQHGWALAGVAAIVVLAAILLQRLWKRRNGRQQEPPAETPATQ